MKIFKQSKKGFALIFVIIIAAAMMIPVLMLLSSAAPRKTAVTGEAVSDRALTLADGRIDYIVSIINTFPTVDVSGESYENEGEAENAAKALAVAYWEGLLNGYSGDEFAEENKDNVSVYFYNTNTDSWYVIWEGDSDSGHLKNVASNIKLGSQINSGDSINGTVLSLPVKNLTSELAEGKSIYDYDPDCLTNNIWFEVDTNTVYNRTPTDLWTITASAYALSNPKIIRTVQAQAEKSFKVQVQENTQVVPPETRKVWSTDIGRTLYFSEFLFLCDYDVNYGRYATIVGPVRANGTINMGGWAAYPIYSTKSVTDIAVDDGNNRDGRFGPQKKTLTNRYPNYDGITTPSPGEKVVSGAYVGEYYVNDNNNGYGNRVTPISWLQVDKALYGTKPVRDTISDTGLQDEALQNYYISGNATVVFSVDKVNGKDVGKVTINGTKYDMPPNGIIYVEGVATVKGEVLGRVTLGAKGNVLIGGDITYKRQQLLRDDESDPEVDDADFLGLVSGQNIFIPYNTYQNDKNLVINAAMVANKCIGINYDEWGWHTLDPKNGAKLTIVGTMASGSGQYLMTQTSGNSIKGYDIRTYKYDWNQRSIGAPTIFPATGLEVQSIPTIVNKENMQNYLGFTDEQWNTLDGILQSAQNPEQYTQSNPKIIDGRAYWFNSYEVVSGGEIITVYRPVSAESIQGLYRISWKELIDKPVEP